MLSEKYDYQTDLISLFICLLGFTDIYFIFSVTSKIELQNSSINMLVSTVTQPVDELYYPVKRHIWLSFDDLIFKVTAGKPPN